MADEIGVRQRLLDHLDALDKRIFGTAVVLLSTSLVYLSFFYDISNTFTVPLIELELNKTYAYHIGVPLIFLLLQLTYVSVVGMLRIEEALVHLGSKDGFDPMIHTLRYPTVFTVLFLLCTDTNRRSAKVLFGIQTVIIVFFFYGTPLITCGHILFRLIESHAHLASIVLSCLCSLLLLVEANVGLILSMQRLFKYASQPRQVQGMPEEE